MPPFAIELPRDLAHGRCVAVTLPASDQPVGDDVLAPLHEAERQYARALAPARQVTWVGGRLALRAALADLGITAGPILPDARGAPRLPAGAVGSISHKAGLAVALAAPDDGAGVGVDLEDLAAVPRQDISRRVLTEPERLELASLDEASRQRETLIRFAAKEAIYKAADRFLRRYVSFHEAALSRSAAGLLIGRLTPRPGEPPLSVELAEPGLSGPSELFLVTARLRPVR